MTKMATAASSLQDASAAPPSAVARVSVAGATGYAGQELLRLLARHPAVRVSDAMSSAATSTPRRVPALKRIWDGPITPLDVDRLAAGADIVCLALPEAAAAEVGTAVLQRGVRVIDLSGAFRLHDPGARARWYPETHALPAGLAYGLDRKSTRLNSSH